jgi:sigma-B regulation protein RsbU (phosphoserine phosphatase)
MSLQQRMLLLMAALLGLLVVLSAGIGYATAQRQAARDELNDVVEPARERLTRLRQGLTDQATGLRGYLLSRDPAFLGSYRAGAVRMQRARQALAELLEDREPLASRQRAVSEEIRRWEAEVAEPQLALARDGRWEEARERVASRAGEEQLREIRSATTELGAELAARQSELAQAATTSGRWLRILVAVTLIGGFAHVTASGWLLRRWVTRPLDRVSRAAVAVAEGARNQPVPVTGPPDVARLGETVERMRSVIVGLLEDAVRAREALEQQGQAVRLFRQELAASRRPLPAGVSAAGYLRPAEGLLAGDWYELLPRDDGTATSVVVDVSGHGTRAGVLALRAKHVLETAVARGLPPGEALAWLAAGMGESEEDYLTTILAEVDSATGTCRYANAGHHPGLVLRPTGQVRYLEPTGPLLGPLSAIWSTETVTLATDAVLLLHTDGIVEARNGAGEEFGLDRLIRVAECAVPHGPAAVLQACTDAVTAFAEGGLTDDVTVVALAVAGYAADGPRPPDQPRRPWAEAVDV